MKNQPFNWQQCWSYPLLNDFASSHALTSSALDSKVRGTKTSWGFSTLKFLWGGWILLFVIFLATHRSPHPSDAEVLWGNKAHFLEHLQTVIKNRCVEGDDQGFGWWQADGAGFPCLSSQACQFLLAFETPLFLWKKARSLQFSSRMTERKYHQSNSQMPIICTAVTKPTELLQLGASKHILWPSVQKNILRLISCSFCCYPPLFIMLHSSLAEFCSAV